MKRYLVTTLDKDGRAFNMVFNQDELIEHLTARFKLAGAYTVISIVLLP